MKYQIVLEGHHGVCEEDDRVLEEIEAETPNEALTKFISIHKNFSFYQQWNCFLLDNSARKIFAKELND